MHIIHVYNECESPYGVGAVAFMVFTYQERWLTQWCYLQNTMIYVHVYARHTNTIDIM